MTTTIFDVRALSVLCAVTIYGCGSTPDEGRGGPAMAAGKAEGSGGGCRGYCGGQSQAGCWCDDACTTYGDCCGDRKQICQQLPSEDPCEGVTCTTPPAPSCVDANTLRTYVDTGVCIEGTCSYEATDTVCTHGCKAGRCSVSAYGFPEGVKIGALGSGLHTTDLSLNGACRKKMKTYHVKCAGWVKFVTDGKKVKVSLAVATSHSWYYGYQNKYSDPNDIPSYDKFWNEYTTLELDGDGQASYEKYYDAGRLITCELSASEGSITVDYTQVIHPHGCHPDTNTCHLTVVAPQP